LTFRYASDGRIATHLAYLVHVHGDEKRLRTEIGSGARGFIASMSGTHNNDIVIQFHI
jgi:hypothetical protein